jgi:hypothetical protein
MRYRRATKSAVHKLGIVGRAALALALAIGASGAILSIRPTPFFYADAQIEIAAAVGADSTGSASLPDGNYNSEAAKATSQRGARRLRRSGEPRSSRTKALMLSISRFITSQLLRSNHDQGESARLVRQHGF